MLNVYAEDGQCTVHTRNKLVVPLVTELFEFRRFANTENLF